MHKLMENTKMRVLTITIVSALLLVVVAIAVAAYQIGRKGAPVTEEDKVTTVYGKDVLGAFKPITEESEADTTTQSVDVTTQATTKSTDTLLFSSNRDGSCTLVGMGDCTDSVLFIPDVSPKGETVTAIADRALEGCASLTELHLPSSIRSVGRAAFVGCTSLQSIYVSAANTAFTSIDGILFSRDKSTLICYPAAREGESYLLSTAVQTVAPYAFDGITRLKTILYEGSTAAYQSIRVEVGNTPLEQLSVTCNYKIPQESSSME